MFNCGCLTEQMLQEATERTAAQGGAPKENAPLNTDVYARVVKAVKNGAKIPPGGLDGSFTAELWLLQLEKK